MSGHGPPLDAGTVRILREVIEAARQKEIRRAKILIEKGYTPQGTEAHNKAAGLADALRLIGAETLKRGTE